MLDQARAELAGRDAEGELTELSVVLAADFADNHAMMLAASTPS
jgi:hypothetical protein